jgi:predicted oxidoreductase
MDFNVIVPGAGFARFVAAYEALGSCLVCGRRAGRVVARQVAA